MDYEEDALVEALRLFNQCRLDYLDRCNGQRPQRSLDNQTPCQALTQHPPGLSQMWRPSTDVCFSKTSII